MAPSKSKLVLFKKRPVEWKMVAYIRRYSITNFLYKLLFVPCYLHVTCFFLWVLEVFLNVFIIQTIKYTEIDWIAYMQEVEGFLNGTYDYKDLRGDTGPLVYPAGFVYVYSALYYVTSSGQNIRLAQYIFLVLYVLQLYLSFHIYIKTQKVPAYAIVLCTLTSYRIHSIFVLRLFNDPIAVLFFYLSLYLFLSNKWVIGSVCFSLGVSVKMNILLYAPCLLVAYLTNLSYVKTIVNILVCGFVQLLLGLPFLYANYWSYVRGSFDLSRIFEHKWTVNYRFLDRDVFEHRFFHLGLLAVHVVLLLVFVPLFVKYLRSYATLNQLVRDLKAQARGKKRNRRKTELQGVDAVEDQAKKVDVRQRKKGKPNQDVTTTTATAKETCEVDFSKMAQLFVLPFFVANLIGVACARSLHYQFYSWYFHSLLYLVYSTPYWKPMILLILGVVEYSWNTYPSTVLSSSLLHGCHILLLYGVYRTMKQ